MNADGKMRLGFLMNDHGVHPGAWLHPDVPRGHATDLGLLTAMAQTAERAKFDMLFRADTPAARTRDLDAWSRFPMFMNVLEPLTLLSALAGATTHLGLGATATTSFTEPYNIARQFASLDQLSAGRAGWNVVTSANEYVALNFGLDELPPHDERYERARECVDLVRKLWDTWEDDAFIRDRALGLTFDPAKQHAVKHTGKYFTLDGALNIQRSPQGHPVIIQAGQSEAGRALAAETAEVVFASADTFPKARAFSDDIRARMARFGRDPASLKILPGLSVVVGSSRQEAEDKYQALQDLTHISVSLRFLAGDLETELADLPLDEPIPDSRIPKASNLHQKFFDEIVATIRRDQPTLRQLATSYSRGRNTFRGTVTDIADMMEEWFRGGAADGFMMSFQVLPMGLDDFAREVVPELQRRGLFRTEYTGTTLRDHLGLAHPVNRHVAVSAKAAE